MIEYMSKDYLEDIKKRASKFAGRKLARVAGINKGTVANIKYGIVKNPGIDTLNKISRALDELEGEE